MTLTRRGIAKSVLLSSVLVLMPISVGPIDAAVDGSSAPLIGVAEACAQGFGCARVANMQPPCPNLPAPWYCNFGNCTPIE